MFHHFLRLTGVWLDVVRATLSCVFSLPNPSLSFWIVQVGEVAPAFDAAIPSASASSVSSSDDSAESSPSSTDSAPSAPSSTDSPGGGNGGEPDEDTPEDRDAMDVSAAPVAAVAAGAPDAPAVAESTVEADTTGAPDAMGTTGASAPSARTRPRRNAKAPNRGPVSVADRQERNTAFFENLVDEWRGKVGVVPGWTEEHVTYKISCIQEEWDEAIRRHELKLEEERLQRELNEEPCLACGKNDDTANTLLCDKPVGDGGTCNNTYHIKCVGLKRRPRKDVSEWFVLDHIEKVAREELAFRHLPSGRPPTCRVDGSDNADQMSPYRLFRCFSVSVVLPKMSRGS